MRVLLSAFHCNPNWGSEFSTGWNWATVLTEMGHEVTVLTESEFRADILRADPQGVDFRFIDSSSSMVARHLPGVGLYDRYNRWQDAAYRAIRAEASRFDIAHHVTWGGLHLGSQLWRLPIPFIYGPIGGGQTAPPGSRPYFGRSWPVELARTASTGPILKLNVRCRETLRHSAVTLVCNSATGNVAKRLGAPDVRFMLADGLASTWIGAAHAQPTGIPLVLYVGRFIPRKAPVLAVEAFARLRAKMPVRMAMAGYGPMRPQVEAAIDRLGLSADIDVLGTVAHGDIKSLYDSASALLFPSLRESFGAPFLESMARGVPAVALNLNGIGDAKTGEAAVKVDLPSRPVDLPGLLAAGLETVLTDGSWPSRSAAAIKFASEWLWPVKAAAATEIYREIAR